MIVFFSFFVEKYDTVAHCNSIKFKRLTFAVMHRKIRFTSKNMVGK
jgi:hypothetical protein